MIAVPDELETVDVGEWHARVERAHCDGFAMFDWLTAVDRMDSGTPGFDVVVRLIALPEVNSATGLRGIRKSFQLAARASKTWPGGKEPGEGHDTAKSPSRRRVQAPGVPPPEWGPR